MSTVKFHTLLRRWNMVNFVTSAGIVTVCEAETHVVLAGKLTTISVYIITPVEVVKRAVRVDVVVDIY